MILKERIEAFVKMGLFINQHFNSRNEAESVLHQGLDEVIELAYHYNGWFSPNFVKDALLNLSAMMERKSLEEFCENNEILKPKTVAVICAGNIPMVCFHDFMCVILSGNKVLLKLSSDDNVLMPFFIKLLVHYEPKLEEYITFSEGKLTNFDAVIATGSNNTATHFQYYFGKYPNIIRKNRTSIAVIKGDESTEDLKNLGKDVFMYYGLGCRNVSKLLVPLNYNFNSLFESIVDYGFVVDNKKYGNNYDYHRAINLLEQQKFLDNNFLMIKESEHLHSPVGTLYFQYYKNEKDIEDYIELNKGQLQCVVGKDYISFGYSQRPVISDYADNVNTQKFLLTL